jgi:hypothetical protein
MYRSAAPEWKSKHGDYPTPATLIEAGHHHRFRLIDVLSEST